MGDTAEEYTKEELEILGESEEQPGPETGSETTGEVKEETEEKEEEREEVEIPEGFEKDEWESLSEKARDKVNQRFGKLTAVGKTAQEKLDLLKSDPNEYYRQYPEEYVKPEEAPKEPPSISSMKNARVRAPGQPVDGLTLGQIYAEDPFLAMDIYNNYLDKTRSQEQAKVDAKRQAEESTTNEVVNFQNHLSKELFQATPDSLSDDQAVKLGDIIQTTIDWMAETGKTGYNILDAYQLMVGPQKIASAKSSAVQKVLKTIESAAVSSVSNRSDGGVKTGFGQYLNMSTTQFATAIKNMPDDEFNKLMKEAPPELRKKYPAAPWD